MLTKEEMPACPVATTVQLIGSKWKLLIMRNLLQRPWRFNELRKNLEGISQKVLTDSLRSMEEDGIITRTVYPEVPPRVEYALSALGESCGLSWTRWKCGETTTKTRDEKKPGYPPLQVGHPGCSFSIKLPRGERLCAERS